MEPEKRFFALDALFDYSRGTLWWVSNKIWNENVSGFVWKKKSRHHPGLSVARRRAEGLYSTIPMLIGTSRRPFGCQSLQVRNLNPEGSAHRNAPGYFSMLRPCHLLFGDFGRAGGIEQNLAKPRLERDEMQKLNALLAGREI